MHPAKEGTDLNFPAVQKIAIAYPKRQPARVNREQVNFVKTAGHLIDKQFLDVKVIK